MWKTEMLLRISFGGHKRNRENGIFHIFGLLRHYQSVGQTTTAQILRKNMIARSALSIRAVHIILMFVCLCVRTENNWFLRRGTEGGFTAAVYWCFARLILKDPKGNSSQVKLRGHPFGAFLQGVCVKTMSLQIRPGTAPLGKFSSNWRFLTLCHLWDTSWEYGRSPSLRAPAEHGVSSIKSLF